MATNNVNDFSNPIAVSNGGTGVDNTTAYGLICGGTTTTGALQNAGTGTIGQILTSAGSSSLPTWTTPSSGSWVLLSTKAGGSTGGNKAVFDDTIITSSYNNYVFILTNMGGGGPLPPLECSYNNGSSFLSFISGINYYDFASTTISNFYYDIDTRYEYVVDNTTPSCVVLFIYNLSSGYVFINSTGFGNDGSESKCYNWTSGYSNSTSSFNYVYFSCTSGSISCYGIVS